MWGKKEKMKKKVNHIFIWRTPDGIVCTPGGMHTPVWEYLI